MGEYDAIFEGIENAKPISTWTKNLAVGTHTVALAKYRIKKSDKEMGNIVEADFVVLESTAHEQGEKRGWAWFIDAPGWTGKYNTSRAKDFLKEMGKCIGDSRPTKDIGADFVSKKQNGRGTQIKVVVTPVFNDDGSPKLRKNGEPVTNAEWTAIPQSLEDVAEMRSQLDELDGDAADDEPEAKTESKAAETKASALAKLSIKGLKRS